MKWLGVSFPPPLKISLGAKRQRFGSNNSVICSGNKGNIGF